MTGKLISLVGARKVYSKLGNCNGSCDCRNVLCLWAEWLAMVFSYGLVEVQWSWSLVRIIIKMWSIFTLNVYWDRKWEVKPLSRRDTALRLVRISFLNIGGKACYHCFHDTYYSLLHSEHWIVLFWDKEICHYSSFIAIMYVGCNLKESNSVLSKWIIEKNFPFQRAVLPRWRTVQSH